MEEYDGIGRVLMGEKLPLKHFNSHCYVVSGDMVVLGVWWCWGVFGSPDVIDFVVCMFACFGMLSTHHISGSWAASIDQSLQPGML